MKDTEFYSLFELSPIPMWVFDIQTLRFLDVNVVAVNNYGYSKEEFLSMTISQIRPDEDVQWVRNIVRENLRTGNFYEHTFRHVCKGGRIINVEIASNLIKIDGRKARLVMATDITEKLRAQQDLLLSEKRFRALVQDASDMITIIDEDFKYTYVSPASVRVFGLKPEFFIGKRAFEYIHIEDQEIVERETERIWDEKIVYLSPYRYLDNQGNWLWIETRATNLFDDPSIKGIVCISRDVTQRIIGEKLIQENIDRFNIVSKATSDVIWDCDLASEEVIWNKAIKGILRHSDSERTTSDWWKQHIHKDDRERVVKKLEDDLKNRISTWQDEYRFLGGDGIYRHIFDRGFVLLGEDGNPIRMIGAMQDITLRKKEERWSKLLESVVVNTSDAVLVTDASLPPVTIYVNAALITMSGYSREELIGSLPELLHGKNSAQPGLSKLRKVVSKQTACMVEVVNYHKSGSPYNVSINLTPVFDDDGKLIRWISIQRNVTEQRLHMNEIESQNKKLNEISWMQSHVVRAPLARIMSLVELMDECSEIGECKELMGYLKHSAAELDQIITAIANRTSLDKTFKKG